MQDITILSAGNIKMVLSRSLKVSPGVYQRLLQWCDMVYKAETGRTLAIRFHGYLGYVDSEAHKPVALRFCSHGHRRQSGVEVLGLRFCRRDGKRRLDTQHRFIVVLCTLDLALHRMNAQHVFPLKS